MSPARRRTGSLRSLSRFAAIHDALHRARRRHRRRRRQRKLRTPAKIPGSRSKVPSVETDGAICQQGQGADGFEELPEDILHRIHSLLPIEDAARAACVSRGFLHSWRHYSNLTLYDNTLGFDEKIFEERKTDHILKIDKILTNHYANGVTVKTLQLELINCSNIKAYLDRWLQITIRPGIQELCLVMTSVMKKRYSFPCSVLSDEAAASSIQSLRLLACDFHPTSTLGCLRRLKRLSLSFVHITEEELGHLLSKSSALERFDLFHCSGIICLKIPNTLQQLKFFSVKYCKMVQVVQIDAPQLCSFHYEGTPVIYVRNSSQLKNVNISAVGLSGILSHARFSLPSIAQNVESLTLYGCNEDANTPMLSSKLPHLKNLEIILRHYLSPNYDVFSLVSFLDASPALESFILRLELDALMQVPGVEDNNEYRRQNLERRHNSLRKVTITGFRSAKSLVELIVHILDRTHSLERLTLDTTYGYNRWNCNIGKFTTARIIGQCRTMSKRALEEAHRAVEATGKYIKEIVPSSVQFEVLGVDAISGKINDVVAYVSPSG